MFTLSGGARRKWLNLLLAVLFAASFLGGAARAHAAPLRSAADAPVPAASAVSTGSFRYFTQTGHFIRGVFLTYWQNHGALPVLGAPLTEALNEDGLVVQYLERARLEWHPEVSSNPRNQVLLTRLGSIMLESRGVSFDRLVSGSDTPRSHFFQETGHNLANAFLTYWLNNGGLGVFGYPLSEEVAEVNAADGKTYAVQYFERARFEWHPELGPIFNVQLGLLGVEYARSVNLNPLARVLITGPIPAADQDLSDSPTLANLVDADLLPAIKLLGHTSQFRWVPAVIIQNKVQVTFETINEQDVGGAFIATNSRSRPYIIVIPSSERGEAPEALASVLAHEATHAFDATSGAVSARSNCSVEEETRAYMNGLASWLLLKGEGALTRSAASDGFERDLVTSLREFNNNESSLTFDFDVQNGRDFIRELYGPGCGR